MNKKEKVLVAMSGGVDSSVAAALLLEQGYNVTGAFMVNYDEPQITQMAADNTDTSCWIEDYRDAMRVAAKLGISLLKFDFTKEYKEMVLDYMFAEYEAGRTPNPDVMCNKFVKFGVWLNKARELGFDKLATGHYAHVSHITYHISPNEKLNKSLIEELVRDTCYVLRVPKDKDKDQTYFLHQLTQDQLSHVLFPLGDYLKSEVRSLACRFDLPNAEKEESMGICFVGEVNMKDFLKDKIKAEAGDIVLSDGTVIGRHEGLAFYTIGQRHVGIASGQWTVDSGENEPLFVIDKRLNTNELVIGYEDDPLLWKREIQVSDIHWISGRDPFFPLQCEVRLRHRQPLQKSKVKSQKSKVVVEFEKPQRAVTPGQFAVLYVDGECLGGGTIE